MSALPHVFKTESFQTSTELATTTRIVTSSQAPRDRPHDALRKPYRQFVPRIPRPTRASPIGSAVPEGFSADRRVAGGSDAAGGHGDERWHRPDQDEHKPFGPPQRAVPVGNTLIVELATGSTSSFVSLSDTKSDLYVLDATITNTGNVRTDVYSATVNTALTTGDSITVSFGSNPSSAVMSVLSVSGLTRTSAKDQTHGATGSSFSPNSGPTNTTSVANELLIGEIGVEATFPSESFSAGAGYTSLGSAGTSGGGANSNSTIRPEYRIVSSTNQYSANGTLENSREWAAAIVTYRIASTPVVTNPGAKTNTEGNTVSLQIVANNSDGSSLTYSAAGLPPGLSINSTTGLITGTVGTTFSQHGPYSVTVSATNTSANSGNC